MNALICGCDPGLRNKRWPAGYVCERHQKDNIVGFQITHVPIEVHNPGMTSFINSIVQKEEDALASREAAGLDKTVSAGNGEQAGFSTGATRSTDAGKIDYEGHLNPQVLALFGEYMNAHRVQRDGRVRASDNWQKGIPLYRYVKSLIRHVFEFWRMWRGYRVMNVDNGLYFTMHEVLSAILFNVMGIIYELDRINEQDGMLGATMISNAERERFENADNPNRAVTVPTQKESDDCTRPVRGGYIR